MENLKAPLELAYPRLKSSESYAVGAALVALSATALTSPSTKKEMTNMGLGLWLMASPWVLETHHHAAATANTFIVGLVVFVVVAIATRQVGAKREVGSPQ